MANPLSPDDVLLLDGGLATELESMGHSLKHRLWSAKLLLEQPQAIIDAHLAYLRAGAQCIISASYQASFPGLMQFGLSRAEAVDVLLLSIDLARQAASQYCQETSATTLPLVAASIGPYGAFLADGAEYRGNYQLDSQALFDFHQPRLEVLAGGDTDVLACETIPCQQEAEVLNTLLAQQAKPAWVSFSCRDGERLSDGSLLADMAALFKDNEQVVALGVNCTAPQYVNALIENLRPATDKAIVVYPNSGEHFDPDTKCWQGHTDPFACAEAAVGWRERGASIIGGCCRMGPEHIAAMRGAFFPSKQPGSIPTE